MGLWLAKYLWYNGHGWNKFTPMYKVSLVPKARSELETTAGQALNSMRASSPNSLSSH